MCTQITVLLLAFSVISIEGARILAWFPSPSISHQVVFRPLTQELAKGGHEVTVITPDPAFPNGRTPANLTEIDVHDISYEKWQTLYKLTSKGDGDPMDLIRIPFLMMVDLVEMQLNVDALQRVLKEEKFDLLLLEACVRPALVLSHIVKVPVILVSSFGPMSFNIQTVGSAWHPLLYPDSLSKRLYNTTNWEKLEELWNFYKLETIMNKVEDAENELAIKLFGPNSPTINELKNNVDMLFLNTYPTWEGNRPVPPSVVFMGGIHQNPVKELPTVSFK